MDAKGKGKMVDVEPVVSDVEPEISDDSFDRMLSEASDYFARKKGDSGGCSYEVQSERNKDVVQEDVTQGLEAIQEFDDIREVECSSDDASYSAKSDSSDTDESVEPEADGQESEQEDVSVDEDNYFETPRERRDRRLGDDPAFTVGMSFAWLYVIKVYLFLASETI